MHAIHIRMKIDSETLHLPELKPLIGKTVEIVVREQAANPDAANWAALEQLARDLKDYDFDAYREQREFDLRHAKDRSS